MEAQNIVTPIGDLDWVFITGQGKKDPQGKDRFSATLTLDTDSESCNALKEMINEFWDENKPAKAKKPKSLGFRDLEDDDGEATGKTAFTFWSGTQYPGGDPKVIKVFNAKGAEVSLGSKRIGNGSRGRINGAIGIYDQGVAAMGATLYLNGVQLVKFKPYEGGVAFDAVETDDDDAFEGFDDMEMPPVQTETNEEAKPRL
jgi:hypothetical protein